MGNGVHSSLGTEPSQYPGLRDVAKAKASPLSWIDVLFSTDEEDWANSGGWEFDGTVVTSLAGGGTLSQALPVEAMMAWGGLDLRSIITVPSDNYATVNLGSDGDSGTTGFAISGDDASGPGFAFIGEVAFLEAALDDAAHSYRIATVGGGGAGFMDGVPVVFGLGSGNNGLGEMFLTLSAFAGSDGDGSGIVIDLADITIKTLALPV